MGDYAQWQDVATQASALLPAPADTAAAQHMRRRMLPADCAPQTSRWLCAMPAQG